MNRQAKILLMRSEYITPITGNSITLCHTLYVHLLMAETTFDKKLVEKISSMDDQTTVEMKVNNQLDLPEVES